MRRSTATPAWVSAYEVDPFDVDEATKTGRMLGLNEALLAAPGVSHANAMLGYVHENKYFANLAGTSTTQQRVRIQAQLTAVSVGDHGFATMRTLGSADRAWLGILSPAPAGTSMPRWPRSRSY